jgi:integrase
LKHSPLEGVELPKAGKRKRILNEDEFITVWHATTRQGYPYGTVCKLLMLTGQREGEIANLRRQWINEKEQTITLPEWICKNRKEHTFPYGDVVAGILESIPRRNDTDLLFPCRISNERPISGWSKHKKELDDGVTCWTLHDLRRTYRSIHGQIGTPSEIAERLINHAASVQTGVEEIYDRWHYLPQMRISSRILSIFWRLRLLIDFAPLDFLPPVDRRLPKISEDHCLRVQHLDCRP